MLTAQQNLEYPLWKELARAIISRGAMDYIVSLMVLNGESVPRTANYVDIHSHPDRIRDDCETFFFSGWFRLLSADSGLDGMVLATEIERDWRAMYERMLKAKSGRPIKVTDTSEEAIKDAKRRRARERYYRKKAEKALRGEK